MDLASTQRSTAALPSTVKDYLQLHRTSSASSLFRMTACLSRFFGPHIGPTFILLVFRVDPNFLHSALSFPLSLVHGFWSHSTPSFHLDYLNLRSSRSCISGTSQRWCSGAVFDAHSNDLSTDSATACRFGLRACFFCWRMPHMFIILP